jgi:hypothetical protein
MEGSWVVTGSFSFAQLPARRLLKTERIVAQGELGEFVSIAKGIHCCPRQDERG